MVNYYDELEIEDFAWDPVAKVFHYPCPCGDRFEISKGQLRDGEEIATCPSCSLIVRVIYDYVSGFLITLAVPKPSWDQRVNARVCRADISVSWIGRITSRPTRKMKKTTTTRRRRRRKRRTTVQLKSR
jgi:hypothetical protein